MLQVIILKLFEKIRKQILNHHKNTLDIFYYLNPNNGRKEENAFQRVIPTSRALGETQYVSSQYLKSSSHLLGLTWHSSL